MRVKWMRVLISACMLLLLMTACGSNTSGTEKNENHSSEMTETESYIASDTDEDSESEKEEVGATQNTESNIGDSESEQTERSSEINTESEGAQDSSKPDGSFDSPVKPSESEKGPTELQTKPTESQTKPSESQTKPSESQTKPSDTQTKPSESEDEPTVTETPSKPDEKPSESQTKPSESQSKPSESEDDVNSEPTESESNDSESAKQKYVITVKSKGGCRLYNAKIHVYSSDTKQDLVLSAATGSNGSAVIELVPRDDYVFTVSNVPEGYKLEESYTLKDTATSVVLESSLVMDKDIMTAKLREGDVMYDFSVTNVNGETLKLSEILKEKKMVMLNFWYVNCAFCVAEFPYMSSAYEQYKDDVEIVALNPFDNVEAVKTFLDENPLPFEVATCPVGLPGVFGVQAYPVSVVIDRYGVIRDIEKEAILEEDGFVRLFKNYTR